MSRPVLAALGSVAAVGLVRELWRRRGSEGRLSTVIADPYILGVEIDEIQWTGQMVRVDRVMYGSAENAADATRWLGEIAAFVRSRLDRISRAASRTNHGKRDNLYAWRAVARDPQGEVVEDVEPVVIWSEWSPWTIRDEVRDTNLTSAELWSDQRASLRDLPGRRST